MEKLKDLHIGETIKRRLKENKRSKAWLAAEMDYDDSSLRKALENKHLHSELLFNICIVLKEDFFAYYSEKVKENLKKFS